MKPTRNGALVVGLLVLLVSCSSASETPTAAPETTPPSVVEPPLLFGAATDTTLVIASHYGPLVALALDTGNAQRFDDTDGVPGDHAYGVLGLGSSVVYPGSGGVLRLPSNLEGPPAPLGRTWVFMPASRNNRLLLADLPTDDTGPYRVREVDEAGDVQTEATTPPGSIPVGGVGGQIVVQQVAELALYDPAAGAVTRSLGSAVLLATRGDRMAVTEGCDACAAVRVIDVDASVEDVVVQTSGPATDAAFSPDGRRLAIWSLAEDGSTASLDVLDLTTGGVAPIRGSAAGPYADLAWSPDGSWVFALSRGEVQSGTMITAYEIGQPAALTRTTPYMQSGSIVAIPDGEGPDLGSRPDARECPESDGLDHNGNPLSAVTAGHPCRLPLSN